jgi:hypothetical protein
VKKHRVTAHGFLVPLLATAALFVATAPTLAHDIQVTKAELSVNQKTYSLTIDVDVVVYFFGIDVKHTDRELIDKLASWSEEQLALRRQKLHTLLTQNIEIRFDNSAASFTVALPSVQKMMPIIEETRAAQVIGAGSVPWKPIRITLEGTVPQKTMNVELSFAKELGQIVASLHRPNAPATTPVPIQSGTTWGPISLGTGQSPASESVWWRYFVFGFTHILPYGLDHILFVIGLFLLGDKLGPLLWQMTAFTVAHTLTLGLAAAGVVNLPSILVEPIIALSITVIAIENMATSEMKPWRPAVVFVFGLLHGLGFAGVLGDLGLPEEGFTTALIAFNVGVEFGQLAVIAIAFGLVGWFRQKPWYRKRLALPVSALIGLIGIWWTVERLFF